jgi:hypothetical protein
MGLGKTIITLTSIRHLIDTGFLSGVIIVGPVRVVRAVWRVISNILNLSYIYRLLYYQSYNTYPCYFEFYLGVLSATVLVSYLFA